MFRVVGSWFFEPRYHWSRFHLSLFSLFLIYGSFFAGVYLTVTEVILPRVFAATSSWTQTDWSGGQSDSLATGTVTTYKEVSQTGGVDDIDTTGTAGQVSLQETSGWDSDYTSWQYRKRITFDNTTETLGVTSEALTDFPVLVKLDSETDIDYSKTQDSGQDIRFADGDGTNLSYEIEKWDETGTSYVWVKVPQIDADSNSDYIDMYYGNSGASDGQNGSGVWDEDYSAVWHMKDNDGSKDVSESTANQNNGVSQQNTSVMSESGKIGQALSFDGVIDYISVSHDDSLSLPRFTIEAWYKPNGIQTGFSSIVSDKYPSKVNYKLGFDNNSLRVNGGICLVGWYYSPTYTITDQTWTHLLFSYDGSHMRLYVNGESYGTPTARILTPSSSGTGINIGKRWDLPDYIKGVADEIRISSVARSAAWIAASYKSGADEMNSFGSEVGKYPSSATLTSNIFDSGQQSDWGTITYTTSGTGSVTVKARSDSNADMSGATAWASCDAVSSGSDLTDATCVDDMERYVQYQVTLTAEGASTPVFEDISIAFTPSDQVAPTTNATNVAITDVVSGDWSKDEVTITWTAGADNEGGIGLLGYCVSLEEAVIGTSTSLNPVSDAGALAGLDDGVDEDACPYIVEDSGESVSFDLSSVSGLTLTSNKQYYFSIKALDGAGNVYGGASENYQDLVSFKYDGTAPTNVAYISTPSSNFGNVIDMSFSWPTDGASAASDSASQVLGYQYQINGTDGTWLGTDTSSACSLNYIPAETASYTLTEEQDAASISTGSNIVYFRTVDSACNTSSVATYRTGSITYGGAAPAFGVSCDVTTGVTVTPTIATSNLFALSWSAATPDEGQSVTNYYYMVNQTVPSALSTITSSTTTYIDNATATSVTAGALTGSVRGSNTVYVVAVDDADNYSSSNCIKGTYTLNSTNPDPPLNVSASDASIKASELWRASLAWDEPVYKGTGTLTYKIQRSSDNSSWTDVTTTNGTAYVDTVTDSEEYYWRVGTYDTSSQSQADPSWQTSVSLTPKGTYTEAPSLSSGPTTSDVTTKAATITWSTSRTSDSKVQYGTASGTYNTEEPSNSTQVTSHEINLTSLEPGTTYYYKAKWTDEDGNTGTSDEKTFTTEPPPTVTGAKTESITIDSAVVKFTTNNASKAKVYYGKTTAFGGSTELTTSTSESSHTVILSGLDDDSTYFYKINGFDSENEEYDGTTLEFKTLPRPKISEVRLQEVAGTAQPTIRVTWQTNTATSSIITYYPSGQSGSARDQVDVEMLEGEHSMIIRGLSANTNYNLIVKGVDAIGNEAQSTTQTFTTATDTRPPKITDLKVEGTIPRTVNNEQTAQLIVSWNTDEPSTSQVEFAEGTGTTYTQATQEDMSTTNNHLVLISGLTPSKAYHLRALSKDGSQNVGQSVDMVTITPKATASAFNLVIGNLSEMFSFLKGWGR